MMYGGLGGGFGILAGWVWLAVGILLCVYLWKKIKE